MSSKNNAFGTFHRVGSLFSHYLPYLSFFVAFLLIAATLIAALGLPAAALREDFLALSQQQNLPVCGCSIRTNTVTVKNTGDVTSVYELAQSGTAASWSSLSETRFTLKPGAVKDVRQFIRAPCSAEGAYQNTITLTTLFQTSKKIEQKLSVPLCNNIVTVPVKNTAISCPAQPMLFEVVLANPLSYPELYDLRVEPSTLSLTNSDAALAERAVSLSERSILLGPQQKKKVLVFFNTPSSVYGTATLDLVITTRNSGLETRMPLKAIINQCYHFQVSLPSSIRFCTEFENRVPLELTNTALIANQYQFTAGIMTPEGRSQEEYNLGTYALPGKTKQQIHTDLLVESEPGDYLFGVNAETSIGDLATYAEAPLEITYCDDAGKPLTQEQYDALQQALEPAEPEADEEQETAEEQTTPGDESEEQPISTAFVIFAILVVLAVLVLGIVAARKSRRKLVLPSVSEYESLLRGPKKKSKLLLGILAIVFVLLLVGSIFLVTSIFTPVDEETEGATETGDAEETSTEEVPVQDVEDEAVEEFDEELETEEPKEAAGEEETGEESTPLVPGSWFSVLLILLFVFIALIVAALAHRIQKRRGTVATYTLSSDLKKQKLIDEEAIGLRTRIHDVKERAEKASKKPKKLFRWFGVLLLVALLVAGGVFLAQQFLPEHQNRVVFIDDAFKVRAAEQRVLVDGNTLRIPHGTQITVPLIFRNIDDDTPRSVNLDFDLDWLEPSVTTIKLKSGQEKEADLTIKAFAPVGSYTLIFDVTNDQGELFAADKLNIDIVGEKARLWSAIATGVVLGIIAVLLILIIRKLRKKPRVEFFAEETTAQKKLREAAARAAAEDAERRTAEKAEKRAQQKKKLKKMGTYCVALLIIALLAWGIFAFSRTYAGKLEPPTAVPVEVVTEEPIDYVLNVTGPVNVPIKIINKNKDITYNITAETSEDWITFDVGSVLVAPADSETITLLLAPHGGVKDGTYKLTIKIEEQSDRADKELFNSHLLLKLNKRGLLSTLLAYWLYILFGVAILVALLVILGFEARRRHKAMLQELAVEAKEKAAAPKPKATSKKSKYKLPPTRLKLKE